MENILIIIIVVLIGGIISYLFGGKRKEKKGEQNNVETQLLTHIGELIKNVDDKLSESNKQVNESLKFHSSESNKIIRNVT